MMMSKAITALGGPHDMARVAIAIAALTAAMALKGGWPVAAALAALYVVGTAWSQLSTAGRASGDGPRSPTATGYGGPALEAVAAGTALAIFGPLSPALALAAMSSVRLTALGGPAGAALAIAVTLAGAAVYAGGSTSELAAGLATAGAAAAGAAAAALSIIQAGRTAGAPDRSGGPSSAAAGARAQRVLSALGPVADAHGTEARAAALAASLMSTAGYEAAVVYLRRRGTDELELAASSLPGDSGQASNTGGRVAFEAIQRGCAAPMSRQRAEVPPWALEHGLRVGISAPINGRGPGAAVGAAFVLRREGPASLDDLECVEMLLGLAGRFIEEAAGADNPASASPLARTLAEAGRAPPASDRLPVEAGGIRLDPARERALVGGLALTLSRTEFSLLYSLTSAGGGVVAQDSLVSAGWGEAADRESSGLDVAIYRLRRKLGRAPGGKDLIETVRGRGYRLATDDGGSINDPESGRIAKVRHRDRDTARRANLSGLSKGAGALAAGGD